jgi:hypothetical protein
MDSTDKKRFSEIMAGMAENFSSQLSTPGMALRYDALKDFSIDQIATGASVLMRTRKTMGMPTVAEMIEAISGPKGTMSDRAAEQVNAIMQQIRQVGYYGKPSLDDPVTQRLLSGRWAWKSLCSMTEREHRFWAKEFIDAYQSSQKTDNVHQIEDYGPKLKLLTGKIGRAA